MSLVSTTWLAQNQEYVKIIDSSWHMPGLNRNARKEYNLEHIFNAIYFDIDKYSDQNSNLPHMLPTKEHWQEILCSLGISKSDKIVIYDNSEVISSCRLWYMLLYFGHNKELVYVLDGGLKKWKTEKYPVNNTEIFIKKTFYETIENKSMVKNIEEINENIEKKLFQVIDGRSQERFNGLVDEPRKDLRRGSIPNSACLPYRKLLNSDQTFKSKDELKMIFKNVISHQNKNNIVFSCGSGITSCVLALAYSLINNNYKPIVYDGSWAEYGKL